MPDTHVPSPTPAEYFTARLRMETDCADVHATLGDDQSSIVLLDVRTAEDYAAAHVPGAVSLPHRSITSEALAAFGVDVSFVTYCWGPHCNGATKGAAAIARLGGSVREMLGGIWGWEQEGFDLARTDHEVAADTDGGAVSAGGAVR